MHAIETDKDTVADYSAFDWKTQQSLRVKDREIAMRDAKINSQQAEIVSQKAEINRLERERRQRSDREIMELLHWTPAELEKYRTLAEL